MMKHVPKLPSLAQRLERKHQRTSRKWLRLEATGRTSVVHTDKLQIAEQTGIQVKDCQRPNYSQKKLLLLT